MAKVLLLGQAEAGKSSILKNLQIYFAPKTFRAEAEQWRPVVHLNLLRSVNFILDMLDYKSSSSQHGHNPTSSISSVSTPLSEEVRRLCIRLTPLRQVEELLMKRISGFVPDVSTGSLLHRYHPAKASEISLRPGIGWKGRFRVLRSSESDQGGEQYDKSQDLTNRRIIAACAEDIIQLWDDLDVQEHLARRNIALQNQAGFFLDDVKRIAEENYIPTPEDILRARVQTMGPEEHHIPLESENGKEWIVYDVGGSRSQRAAWAQFFDNVTTIIFLAPASAFNQVLVEDETVNRMADTMKLWRNLCGNRLLQSVELVLFLNKMDILDKKLKAGIQFAKYVTSYKDRPNETQAVAKYLLDVFHRLHTQHTPKKRKVYAHTTCATDTKATSVVISQIREVILMKTLHETSIL